MDDLRIHSLRDQALLEAHRHKWIESERHHRDLGDWALFDWVQKHWLKFVRACWAEHMRGQHYWREIDRNDFGILTKLYEQHRELVQEIYHRLRSGEENLDVICWAMERRIDMNQISPVLECLDINRCRAIPDPLTHPN